MVSKVAQDLNSEKGPETLMAALHLDLEQSIGPDLASNVLPALLSQELVI